MLRVWEVRSDAHRLTRHVRRIDHRHSRAVPWLARAVHACNRRRTWNGGRFPSGILRSRIGVGGCPLHCRLGSRRRRQPGLALRDRGQGEREGVRIRRRRANPRRGERTTPAGRFEAAAGRNYNGVDIIWVDYPGAVSLHRVITSNPKERRLERLATPTSAENRISWGRVNVPARFFDAVVRPAFAGGRGIVYVLPETRPVRGVFGSYDVEERARQRASPARPE